MRTKIYSGVAALLTAAAIMLGGESKAQGIHVGPRVGLNFATVSADGPIKDEVKSITGFTAGGVVNIGFSDMISIQPELLFSTQGYSMDLGGDIGKQNVNLNYINLPILLKLSFGGDKIKFFANAGPQFGYLLGGTHPVIGLDLGTGQSTVSRESFSAENLKEMNRVDVGVALGAGVGMGMGPGDLQLDLRYVLGVTNIDKNTNTAGTIKGNNVFMVSLAYLFGFGD